MKKGVEVINTVGLSSDFGLTNPLSTNRCAIYGSAYLLKTGPAENRGKPGEEDKWFSEGTNRRVKATSRGDPRSSTSTVYSRAPRFCSKPSPGLRKFVNQKWVLVNSELSSPQPTEASSAEKGCAPVPAEFTKRELPEGQAVADLLVPAPKSPQLHQDAAAVDGVALAHLAPQKRAPGGSFLNAAAYAFLTSCSNEDDDPCVWKDCTSTNNTPDGSEPPPAPAPAPPPSTVTSKTTIVAPPTPAPVTCKRM